VTVDARVAGGALVVSFSGSGLPKVWRADMAHMATSGLELREEGGKVVLMLTSPAAREDVYAFPDRDSAAEGLKAITRALFGQALAPGGWPASGQGAPMAPPSSGGFFKTVFKVVGVLALVLFALTALTKVLMPGPEEVFMEGVKQPLTGIKNGVPVPADQLFGGK
jgi:hypothetical protein